MRVVTFAVLILTTLSVWAQAPSCGQAPRVQDWPSPARIDTIPTTGTLNIPVVVHILWHTEAENLTDTQVLSQLEALNRDYLAQNEDRQYVPAEFTPVLGNPDIHFCLAAIDPWGLSTTAIERRQTEHAQMGTTQDWYLSAKGGLDAWDPTRYLNIWVVNTGAFVTGFASYPAPNIPYNGVVIHPDYFGIQGNAHYGLGRVATHEIGHYLGLLHPWGDDSDCSTDDHIADTPPQYVAHGGCPSYPAAGCASSEMFMNFMDYVDDQCMLLFTHDQATKMRETLLTFRYPLSASTVPCLESTDDVFALSASPNPSDGWVQIRFQNPPMKLVTYDVVSATGQKVKHSTSLINDILQLDLTDLAPGVYYLHCEGKVARLLIV